MARHLLALLLLLGQNALGQEDYKLKIEGLQAQKQRIAEQEKEALKQEVLQINQKLDRGEISRERATKLKGDAAKVRAMNMENRIAILDHRIALLERNQGKVLSLPKRDSLWKVKGLFDLGEEPWTLGPLRDRKGEIKYDRRTYGDLVVAVGLNNALVEGQVFEDGPYRLAGSRFFELGWQWRTRVFSHSNWLRLNYGISYQSNGLKPKGNHYFRMEGDQTVLEEFEFALDKVKLRMDHLVLPLHFEIGPSKYTHGEHSIRYSIRNQFRLGLGGYGGLKLGTRQKLKYRRDGQNIKDKLTGDYNTHDLIYGFSGYMGFDGVLLYLKYDMNPLFKDAVVEQHNISLGLRLDI